MTPQFTLKAHERLKSKKQIERLFLEGETLFKFPFKLHFILEAKAEHDGSPLQFGVAVPKRKIKSAVNRNLIKRRAREAYRQNKLDLQQLLMTGSDKLSLMFIYIHGDICDYNVIEKSFKFHLNELVHRLTD